MHLFCNPDKAGLVATIDDYPGLTTWNAFKTCEPSVDAEVAMQAYWTPLPVLEALPEHNRLSSANNRERAKRLRETKGTIECT